MRPSQNVVVLLISFFSLFIFADLELAYSSISLYENQIFNQSSEVKVRKLQEVFKGLGLYYGEVSGKFVDIEQALIDYQLKSGVINTNKDDGAGYFGPKTIKALENDYQEKFLELKETYLKIDEPSLDERYFYITAYYSPLPGQDVYTTGNYAAEIRLNGNGNSTASGKGVYEGLLAAPRNYVFGTKIYLEGLGVGEVGDRGGAIVNAGERGHEYDRLDIWVGYGDEGRIRAKTWGKRLVKGYIVDDDYDVNIELEKSILGQYQNLKIDAEAPTTESVKKLQTLFLELGLYAGDVDGNFNSIKDVLVDYQLSKGIIYSRDSVEAGYFGKKTFDALKNDYGISGGLFVEKYLIPGDNVALSIEKKEGMKLIKQKLDDILNEKFDGNDLRIQVFKGELRRALNDVIERLDNIWRRNELRYLIEIM